MRAFTSAIGLAILLSLLLAFAVASDVRAETESISAEALCGSLDRPDIDCTCVGRRVATFERFAPTADAKTMILEGYKASLGLPNQYETAVRAAYGSEEDFMRRMAIQESLDQLGGEPNDASDFEKGCIIAGTEPISLMTPRPIRGEAEYSTADYQARCLKSVGDSEQNARYCKCTTERLTARLSDLQFEAYFRSFSQYDDGELSEVRGRSMGLSASQYETLTQSAGKGIDPHKDADTNYCRSRNWSTGEDGQTLEERKLAGFESGLALAAAPAALTSESVMGGTPLERARVILTESCSNDGNSETYCGCYMREFENRVVSKAANENVALSWAVTNGNGAMTQMDFIQTVQSIPPADQQAAAMMHMQTYDLGDTCPKGFADDAPEAMKGTPAERMTAICVSDNENQAMCECLTGQMQASLNPDDFELIVDIREAGAQGHDDPLAKVAEDRGLSAEEAEQAMAMNQSLMGSIMGMNMMACMPGMPDMSGMGFPMPTGLPGSD